MRAILLLLLVVGAAQQQPDEPYPGRDRHAKPPEGWFCQHQTPDLTVPPAHVCVCERACDPETGLTTEDRSCTVYCHRDHCHCGQDLPPCGGTRKPFGDP